MLPKQVLQPVFFQTGRNFGEHTETNEYRELLTAALAGNITDAPLLVTAHLNE